MVLKLKRLVSVAIITLAVGIFVTNYSGVIYGANEGLHVKTGNKVGIGTTCGSKAGYRMYFFC